MRTIKRQITLDTETTGLSHEAGHRIIEIGCVALSERKPTDLHFHVYVNPEREVDAGAFRVHGISTAFLQDKPCFQDIIPEFIAFIEGAELIIHNATFDVGFLNAELLRAGWPNTLDDHCTIVDSLVLARQKHRGQRNTLDALCKRYEVDHSNRQLHGALLDAELLAFVYSAMTGGQTHLCLDDNNVSSASVEPRLKEALYRVNTQSLVQRASIEEESRHDEFVRQLIKKSGRDHWGS